MVTTINHSLRGEAIVCQQPTWDLEPCGCDDPFHRFSPIRRRAHD